jgi:hypothetical protein
MVKTSGELRVHAEREVICWLPLATHMGATRTMAASGSPEVRA